MYPRAAGNWLFHGRRWLNPHDPADRALLDSNYTALARAFPPFAASCDRPRFLEILADVAAKWASTLHGHGSAEHIIRWATGPRRRARPAVPSRPAGPEAVTPPAAALDVPGADAALLRRLAEIGFVAGEPVHLLRRGPGGREPLAVQVGETLFALRLLEARCVEVVVAREHHG